MKKYLFLFGLMAASSGVFAKHFFSVCYYNWTNSPISYNNNTPNLKWLDRGTLTGTGTVDANDKKCFHASDETIFTTHFITFYVQDQWYGIANPGFRKPYLVAQTATSNDKSGAKLARHISKGTDEYSLNLHVTTNGVKLSGSADPQDSGHYITPARLVR